MEFNRSPRIKRQSVHHVNPMSQILVILIAMTMILSVKITTAAAESTTKEKCDTNTGVVLSPTLYDAVVVGGGPTGLQGALTLGRSLLKTLVIDAGTPRNWMVKEFHNFIGADGDNPFKFRKKQREHIQRIYGDYVSFSEDIVTAITGKVGEFTLTTKSNQQYRARRILLAMGVQEQVPVLPSRYASQYYKSIFQCPFCHGFEIKGKRLGVVAPPSAEYPLMLKGWSNDVVVFTNGTQLPWLTVDATERLKRSSILVVDGPIADLAISKKDELEAIILQDGTRVERDVIYQKFKHFQQALVDDLKLEIDQLGNVKTTQPKQETSIPGIYAAGDMSSSFHKIAMGVGAACQASLFIANDHRMSIENLKSPK